MDSPSAPLSGLKVSSSAPSDGPEITSPEEGFKHFSEHRMKSKKLCRYILLRDWDKVEQLCKGNPKLLSEGTTSSKDTALHVAIKDGNLDRVKNLVDIILQDKHVEKPGDRRINQALLSSNSIGETALHCAAARGSVPMCELIHRAGEQLHVDLLDAQNKWHENPIFVAIVHNQKRAFIYLYDVAWSKAEDSYEVFRYFVCNERDGDTILHSAIRREHIDLALHIAKRCQWLLLSFNAKGVTPLEELARNPIVFRSTYNLSWWKQIIYFCIHVDPLKYDPTSSAETRPDLSRRSSELHCPENYLLCYHLLSFFGSIVSSTIKIIVSRTMKRSNKSSIGEASGSISQHPDHQLPAGKKKEEGKSVVSPNVNENFPQNYATCCDFLAFVYLHFVGMMGFGHIFGNIRRMKEKYVWSLQLLDQLLEKCSVEEKSMKHDGNDLEWGSFDEFGLLAEDAGGDEAKGEKITNKALLAAQDTGVIEVVHKALLAAAEMGVIEVVHKILLRFPEIIPRDAVGSSNKNILMLAVENQHAEIFEALRQHLTNMSLPNLWSDLVYAVDDHDDTILHIAAKYDASLSHAWQASGSFMQMQCEVTWYEYVKSFVPSHFLLLKNRGKEPSNSQIAGGSNLGTLPKTPVGIGEGESRDGNKETGEKAETPPSKQEGVTPEQIFIKCHDNLLEKGSAWLKDTSESCSVVAALVAGVSYATSTAVPGGTDDNGKPKLEGQPAFELFAISGLMGLGFSVTALVMFLSILTSRKKPVDFRRNLPLKLLLGLSSLFVSITCMFISFCASHFFVLEHKFKKGIFPIYAVTCLPISFYAIGQLPLYADLLTAIFSRVPRSKKYVQL